MSDYRISIYRLNKKRGISKSILVAMPTKVELTKELEVHLDIRTLVIPIVQTELLVWKLLSFFSQGQILLNYKLLSLDFFDLGLRLISSIISVLSIGGFPALRFFLQFRLEWRILNSRTSWLLKDPPLFLVVSYDKTSSC